PEELVGIDRTGMGRIEDDGRAPSGRLHDLERRQFAIKLRHRWAPSPWSRPLMRRYAPAEKRWRTRATALCQTASSIIPADLPSGKQGKSSSSVWNNSELATISGRRNPVGP